MNKYDQIPTIWTISTNINKHEQPERDLLTSWMSPGPSQALMGILWGILLVYFGVYFWIMEGWSLAPGGSGCLLATFANKYQQILTNIPRKQYKFMLLCIILTTMCTQDVYKIMFLYLISLIMSSEINKIIAFMHYFSMLCPREVYKLIC